MSVILAIASSMTVFGADQTTVDSSAARGSSLGVPTAPAPALDKDAATRYTDAHPDPANVQLLRDASKLSGDKKYDEALAKTDTFVQTYPNSMFVHSLRGYIFSKQEKWDQAQKEFETMLRIDPKNSTAKFNLSELKFMQKKYDSARPGFISLEKDQDLADLASYKIFLCDMLAGHTHVASEELAVFNQVGSNPSFYVGNAAWELYNSRPEAARPWLGKALNIYYPYKIQTYVSSLEELGYLPLPPAPGDTTTPILTPSSGDSTNAAPPPSL